MNGVDDEGYLSCVEEGGGGPWTEGKPCLIINALY